MSQKAILISVKLSRTTAATQLMQTHSVTALGSSAILVTPTGVIMRLGIVSQAFSRAAPDHGRKVLADQQNLNRVGSIAGLTGSKSIMLAGKSLLCSSSAACKFLDCQKQQSLMLVLSRLLFWNVPRNGIQTAMLMRASPWLKISSKRHRPHTSTCSLMYPRVSGKHTICHAFVTRYAGQEAFVQYMVTNVGTYMSLGYVNSGICQCVTMASAALSYTYRTPHCTLPCKLQPALYCQTSGPCTKSMPLCKNWRCTLPAHARKIRAVPS